MSEDLGFDERRSAAWRIAIVETARASRAPADTRHKRIALTVAVSIVALLLSSGGVAYALGMRLLPPLVAPSPTPTSVESPTPTPTPEPTEDPVVVSRSSAEQACEAVYAALDANGNVISSDIWSTSLTSAAELAQMAAGLDSSWAGLAESMGELARTPLPGPSATDAEKNDYFNAYLPVATECSALGVTLPTD